MATLLPPIISFLSINSMLQNAIAYHKNKWLASSDCPIKPIITYIRNKGQLRDAQIDALETYLFLKIKGQNKALWQLFAEGFFVVNNDRSSLSLPQTTKDVLDKQAAARSLFEFARLKTNSSKSKTTASLLPTLEQYIINHADRIDYLAIIKQIFYGVSYTDYLFSLPMGAGKTFLMAAIMYLDLYFADSEPDNPLFAHNFIILIPSGLKSSIIPSLKTIQQFDPTWVIPEPTASRLKKMMQFEVLDQSKTAQKSNQAQNPNAQKINSHQPFDQLFGLVMVVNAEKVILDKLELNTNGELLEQSADEPTNKANELRHIIGKIPRLQIHIDEVHHAATEDIKLRQVVSKWNNNGTINSVLGYSGTPYLSSADQIDVDNGVRLKFAQITNTVYYYPLTTAIQHFLKKPRVEQAVGLTSLQIIQRGIDDFLKHYQNTTYNNGSCAKLAIYCGSIEKLEEHIYPFLIGELQISPNLILKYHKGNKQYRLSPENDTEFALLDSPLSPKKIILLVQVGKEGWDCKSLTAVILSQKGDCPSNMILQTSCRCLRQADTGRHESALIWLNEDNAKALDKQLKEEQQTSIYEINRLSKSKEETLSTTIKPQQIQTHSEDRYQFCLQYHTMVVAKNTNTNNDIKQINLSTYLRKATITKQSLHTNTPQSQTSVEQVRGDRANFNQWLVDIIKASFNSISYKNLIAHNAALYDIFQKISFFDNDEVFFNDLYDHQQIQTQIRLVFYPQQNTWQLQTVSVPPSATLLLLTSNHVNLQPNSPLFSQLGQQNIEIHYKQDSSYANLLCEAERTNGGWQSIGLCSPNIVMVQRTDGHIAKLLLLMDKPIDFAKQSTINYNKQHIGIDFLALHSSRFVYSKIQHLEIPIGDTTSLINAIHSFFEV